MRQYNSLSKKSKPNQIIYMCVHVYIYTRIHTYIHIYVLHYTVKQSETPWLTILIKANALPLSPIEVFRLVHHLQMPVLAFSTS